MRAAGIYIYMSAAFIVSFVKNKKKACQTKMKQKLRSG